MENIYFQVQFWNNNGVIIFIIFFGIFTYGIEESESKIGMND